MRTQLTVMAIATAWLSVAAPVRAHHSFAAEFDANKPVTLSGSVTKIEWTNPHTYFYIDVTDGLGKVTNWVSRWEVQTA